MKCKWKSKYDNTSCDRDAIDESGFCIYHKPDKDLIEGTFFWKLINFKSDSFEINSEIEEIFHELKQLVSFDSIDLDSDFDDFFDEPEEDSEINNNLLEDDEDLDSLILREKINIISKYEFINLFLENYSNKNVMRQSEKQIEIKGFIFPQEPQHKLDIKRYDFSFSDSVKILIDEVIFEGYADFNNTSFKSNTIFKNIIFKDVVTFSHANFDSNILFDNIKFNNFLQMEEANTFWKTTVTGQKIKFSNIKEFISLNGIRLSRETYLLLDNVGFDSNSLFDGEDTYRLAKKQSLLLGDKTHASIYYYQERIYKGRQIMPPLEIFSKDPEGNRKFVLFQSILQKKHYKFILPKLGDYLSKILLGYGEKPTRSLFFSIGIIVFYSILFMLAGLLFTHKGVDLEYVNYDIDFVGFFGNLFEGNWLFFKELLYDYGNFLYFSIVTFTTVGYGDITPIDSLAKICSGSEMLFGITLAGIWVATLLRKMMN